MSIKLIADLHTHTIASGHAYGTIRENMQAAKDMGLKLLGITEHAPGIPGTCDPLYFANFVVVPREIYGVKLMLGSEINVLNDGTLSLPERRISNLDFAIAGIHILCYKDEGRTRNTENIISCMKHPKVKIISHPDDDHTPLDYQMLVEGAKRYDVALEVNNSSFWKPQMRINCFDNYRIMLSLCRKLDVPVVVNSDAHDPSLVGKMDLAAAFLEELEFPQELILNTDLDRTLEFLKRQ